MRVLSYYCCLYLNSIFSYSLSSDEFTTIFLFNNYWLDVMGKNKQIAIFPVFVGTLLLPTIFLSGGRDH